MIPVNLIISLGTSIFVALMVFLYFRNRIKSLEFKLNTMFQLIQDHVDLARPVIGVGKSSRVEKYDVFATSVSKNRYFFGAAGENLYK